MSDEDGAPAEWAPTRALDKLAAALAKAQGEIQAAAKNAANPGLRNRYADLASVWDACRMPLSKNGLAVAQCPEHSANGGIVLHTYLLHESGQYLESVYPIHAGGDNRAVNEHQALGAAITYARRYTLAAMVGVAPDDDDDGQGAAGVQPVAQSKPKPATQPKPAGNGSKPAPDEPPVTCVADDAIVDPVLLPWLKKYGWPMLCRGCWEKAKAGQVGDFPEAVIGLLREIKEPTAALGAALAEQVAATEGGAE